VHVRRTDCRLRLRERQDAALALVALAVFGHVKGHFSSASPVRRAIQTVVIGGLAATAAFSIVRAIS
jgi:VIT1/CCC1 family predicted Fe2+/Mn2+ transporter